MSNEKKITIEKREFKIKDGKKFILEYPSNFEEIANKKLEKLQNEYDKSMSDETNKNTHNNDDNKDYYQKIGEIKDENIKEKKEIKLEPQEGTIEIKNNNKFENKNYNMDKEDEEINNCEFYEVEEKEIEYNNNLNYNNKEKNDKIEENKRNISPVKDSENIKSAMKKLNFKAPDWAKNLTDQDFINMAKNKIKK